MGAAAKLKGPVRELNDLGAGRARGKCGERNDGKPAFHENSCIGITPHFTCERPTPQAAGARWTAEPSKR